MSQPNEAYQIPDYILEQPALEVSAVFERPDDAPVVDLRTYPEKKEKLPEQSFAYIKSIEDNIDQLRAAADKKTIALYNSRRAVKGSFGMITKNVVKMIPKKQSLEDIEGEIGGSLVPLSEGIIAQRFWYISNDGWYYESSDAQGSRHVHYIVKNESIEKLTDQGITDLEFSAQEQANLLQFISLYHAAIQSELYPREAAKISEKHAA